MRILLFLPFLLAACSAPPAPTTEAGRGLVTDSAMVVTAHPLASEVGTGILRQGGNAIDAAIAVQFALAVVFPEAGNLGGGGFLVYRGADGTTASLDYREKAPAKAHRDMYLGPDGEVVEGLSENGHLAAGVPGTVAGMEAAHHRYGRLPWKDLVQPAIDLANGYALDSTDAGIWNTYTTEVARYNTVPPLHITGRTWVAGDVCVQTDLAATLTRIRDEGARGFYEGTTATLITEEMQRGGGWITGDDLRAYTAVWRTPVTGTYKDYRLISMPPPTSGGIALLQLLAMLEEQPIGAAGFHSTRAIHTIVEAERRVYADRSEWLGDPDFHTIPVHGLLDAAYLRGRMADFDPTRATRSAVIRAGQPVMEHLETTHYSIVDAEGNAVAVTTTLNGSFGCGVMVAGAGFLLNNEMDDFSARPGVPNAYGLVGGEYNAIAPGKRMLSSMTPTIVERDGKLFMVLGTPGGSTIITGVLQTFLNVTEYGMTMQQAVAAPRFHHQWLPDAVFVERGHWSVALQDSLRQMEHDVREIGKLNWVDAILVLPDGRLEGGADPRGKDKASGF